MSDRVVFSHGSESWGRRALGLFVALWLNLALQPCAMALEQDSDHDCPHCPPAETHAHGASFAHEPADRDAPCIDAGSDCAIVEEWSHDGRGGQLKLEDSPADSPVAMVARPVDLYPARPAVPVRRPRYAMLPAGASPPLHVLFCVYLD